jgi:hypothetical protein
MPRHRKNLPTRKFRLAPAVVGPSCLSSPLLLGLALHGWSVRVLEFEPIAGATGAVA